MKTSEKNIIEALENIDKQSTITELALDKLLSKYGHSIDYNFILASLKIKKYIEQEYTAKYSIQEFCKTNPNQVFPIEDRLEAWNKFTRRCKLKIPNACPPYRPELSRTLSYTILFTFIPLSILFWKTIGFGHFINDFFFSNSNGNKKGVLFLYAITFGFPGTLIAIPFIIILKKWIFYPRITFKTFEELIMKYKPKRKNKDAKKILKLQILQG